MCGLHWLRSDADHDIYSMLAELKPDGRRFTGPMPHELVDPAELGACTYFVTHKADGVRFQLVVTRLGPYLMDRAHRGGDSSITPVRLLFPEDQRGVVFDGEMVAAADGDRPTFWVFDAWTEATAGAPYSQRLPHAKRLLAERRAAAAAAPGYVAALEPFGMRLKVAHKMERLQRALDEMDEHRGDGLVFIPNAPAGPSAPTTWKWKDVADHTVDFWVEGGVPHLAGGVTLPGAELYHVPATGDACDFTTWVAWRSHHGWQGCERLVSEWALRSVGEEAVPGDPLGRATKWVFFRVRHDKSVPNSLDTCRSTVAAHQVAITRDQLCMALTGAPSAPRLL